MLFCSVKYILEYIYIYTHLISSFIDLWSKICLKWSNFLNLMKLTLPFFLSWKMGHMPLNVMLFCCFWIEYSMYINLSNLMSFKFRVFLLIFYSGWTVHWCKWGIWVPTIIVIPCVSSYLLICRCSYVGCVYIYFNCYIFFLNRSFYHYIMSSFVFCVIVFVSKSTL